jgi:hypothetical protein
VLRQLVVAFCVLLGLSLASAGVAAAKPKTRPVQIVTVPEGATVYVGDMDAGKRGETPLTLELPVGESTLVIELAGYETRFETVTVPAAPKRKPKTPFEVSFEMVAAMAQLTIAEPEGAAVLLDGEPVGNAPLTIDVAPGEHTVRVEFGDKVPFERTLEFVAGQGEELTPVLVDPVPADAGDEPSEPVAPPAPTAGPPRVRALVGVQFGMRQVRYQGRTTPDTLRTFDQTPAPAGRLEVELGLGALTKVRALRPLRLLLGAARSLPRRWRRAARWRRWRRSGLSCTPTRATACACTAPPRCRLAWASRATAMTSPVRRRRPRWCRRPATWPLRATVGVDVKAGPVTPYAQLDGRFVLSGGKFGDRFEDASIQSLGAAAGAAMGLPAKLVARLDLGLQRQAWSLTPKSAGVYNASGATDLVLTVAAMFGRDF